MSNKTYLWIEDRIGKASYKFWTTFMHELCPEVIVEKPSPKTTRTALADFIRRFFTPYKCEGRQGVYIDKELHQKISVIVGIAGKRQPTVGNYIDNVLKEHFERHSEEVKAHLQKSYNKIF